MLPCAINTTTTSGSQPATNRLAGHPVLERESGGAGGSLATLERLDRLGLTDGIWSLDRDNPESDFVSDAFWNALGYAPDSSARAGSWLDCVFAEDRAATLASLDAHFKDPAVPFDQTMRVRSATGHTVLIRSRGSTVREDNGSARVIGLHTVIGDLRRAQLSDKLSDVLSLSDEAIIMWSPTSGVLRWNRGAERMYGIARQTILHQQHLDCLEPRFPEEWSTILNLVTGGETWNGEVEWTRPDGTTLITETQLQQIVQDGGDATILQLDRDITAKVELARRQQTLTRELNHRVKNLFAVIRALLRLAAKGEADIKQLVTNLDTRISSLAAAHIVSLGHQAADGAPLDELLDAVLSAYAADPTKLTTKGPHCWVSQDRITPMGLILNELATNSVKYGAWSQGSGAVDVGWHIVESEEARMLSLHWRERQPQFTPPAELTPGFGSELITMSARQMGARVNRHWQEDGLALSLTLSLERDEPTNDNRA